MEWIVRKSKDRFSNSIVVIEPEDFTHDASLIVTGDFESEEIQIEYAEFLADKLNNTNNFELIEALRDFTDKVEIGTIKSRTTYMKFKSLIGKYDLTHKNTTKKGNSARTI